ncbi:DUF2189 domain-containing protein [Acidisoma sp.]|uniref:DUF2189 domain-containing protein n=1 Tax=Acidisoma sp. TaxID=1872115 RepID=UPI003B00D448
MSFATTLSDAFTVVFLRAPPETHEEVAARIEEERDDAASPGPIDIRKVGLNELMPALKAGFEDLRELRTDQVTMAVLFPLAGLVVAGVVADRALLPFLFPAASGFALIGPLATLWYAALSRGRELWGEDAASHPLHLFFGPRGRSLRILGGVAIVLFLLWNAAAGIIYHLTLGTSSAKPNAFFLTRVLTTQAGWEMIVIGCGVGVIFALIAVAIGCVSFPLALDKPVKASEAIRVSISAVARNPVFMLGWGAVIVAGLVIGALPGLLGLAVTLPVLGHATWHVYRRIVA